MVKSNKLWTPREFLKVILGDDICFSSNNDVVFIEDMLYKNGYDESNPLWSHTLEDIEEIIENNLDVVLVDCKVFNVKSQNFIHVCRWFEVPDTWDRLFETYQTKSMLRYRDTAIKIIDEFSSILDGNNIKIPDDNRTGDESESSIYGATYYKLEDSIINILSEKDKIPKYTVD